jgi:acyl-CoA dehydrogenase
VIQKMASRSQVLAISTMVPNSLGPAELILHYGTDEQKAYYLERLADGREIPCFALTEPSAGSDAGSMTSQGVLFKNEAGEIQIRLNFEKRYITLASIATVIGLACVIRDPEHLIGDREDLGITCILVPAKTAGINQGERHDPLGVPFYNAPLWGEEVVVGLDTIIGGVDGIGQGWQMLMQSLSVGRGISLPSTSTGGTKLTARVVGNYAKIRHQFGLNIGKFEGIEEAMARVGANAYMLEAARKYTIGAIDAGLKPAVINAIMKYQATEKYRESINDGMDILGGAGISRGERNLLAHAYVGAPIAITVEGANIMTRTLIVFGQGVIRCHPYAYKEIEALINSDITQFDRNFFAHVHFTTQNAIRACALNLSRGHFHRPTLKGELGRIEQKLVWTSAKFAFWTDIVMALYGGALKRKEKINARFGDILSWQYLITATLRRYKADGEPREQQIYVAYISALGFSKISEAFDGIYRNMFGGIVGKLFYATVGFCSRINAIGLAPSDKISHKIAHDMMDGDARDSLSTGIYMGAHKEDGLGRLEHAYTVLRQNEGLLQRQKRGETLSEEELKTLGEVDAILKDAIMVDSFDLKSYKAHNLA